MFSTSQFLRSRPAKEQGSPSSERTWPRQPGRSEGPDLCYPAGRDSGSPPRSRAGPQNSIGPQAFCSINNGVPVKGDSKGFAGISVNPPLGWIGPLGGLTPDSGWYLGPQATPRSPRLLPTPPHNGLCMWLAAPTRKGNELVASSRCHFFPGAPESRDRMGTRQLWVDTRTPWLGSVSPTPRLDPDLGSLFGFAVGRGSAQLVDT